MATDIRNSAVILLRSAALCVAGLALLCLPIAEFRSGFLLGNLHPSIDETVIFTARWGFDAACIVAILAAAFAWQFARRRAVVSVALLFIAVASPIAGDAYLEHVDSIVSYPPGYFSGS
jgi:hypothetical protein